LFVKLQYVPHIEHMFACITGTIQYVHGYIEDNGVRICERMYVCNHQ